MSFYLSLLITLFLIISCSSNHKSSSDKPKVKEAVGLEPVTLSSSEQAVLNLINDHRSKLGLIRLKTQVLLQSLAKEHSNAMSSGLVPFGHQGFENRHEKVRSDLKISAVAENVFFNGTSPQRIFDGWLNSSGHRKNIEGPYNICGLAISGVYVTHIFANFKQSG